jgi:hypothetical protein
MFSFLCNRELVDCCAIEDWVTVVQLRTGLLNEKNYSYVPGREKETETRKREREKIECREKERKIVCVRKIDR